MTGVDWDARDGARRGPPAAAVRPPGAGRRRHRQPLRHARRGRARLRRSTRWPTPSGCGTTSSSASRRRTPTGRVAADGDLTFVVVGGGPTGVETAGALAELFAMVLPQGLPRARRQPGPGGAGRDAGPPARRRSAPQPPARPRHARPAAGVDVRLGAAVAAGHRRHGRARRRRGAPVPHARVGGRRQGQPAGGAPRRSSRAAAAGPCGPGPAHAGPPRGVGGRRPRRGQRPGR